MHARRKDTNIFDQLRDRMADDLDYGWYDVHFNPRPVVAQWHRLQAAPPARALPEPGAR